MERLEERTVMSSFAVSFGGAGDDKFSPAAAIDPAGNSYLPGFYRSQPADFDPGPGIFNLTSAGGSDAFVAKYGHDGSLAWARGFGGVGDEQARRAIFVSEPTGDYVYVAGMFAGAADFGPGIGVLNSAGGQDTFVLKLDALTGAALWGRQIGGIGSDIPTDVFASNGKLTITGGFNGSGTIDFDPGPGVATMTDANGSGFVWTLDTGGNYVSAWQLPAHIASIVVEDDNLYLRGQFTGTADFDPDPGVQWRASTVNNNFWIGQYTSAGAFGWVQTKDVSVLTSGTMAHDSSALYVATTDYFQATNADAVVMSFSKVDGTLRWFERFGTSATHDYSSTCVINPDTGALYVGGMFSGASLDFQPAAPGGEVYNEGNSDGFVVKLQSATGDYQQVWQIGGSAATEYARVHDARGSKVYVSSSFAGVANFPSGQTFTSQAGSNDGYLVVIDETDAVPPPPPATKFYVVDDGSANKTYEYAGGGASVENYAIHSGNSAPRGAASTAAGNKVWVVDANKKVYVYNPSGGLLGSWSLGSLPASADVQGITVSGNDVWVVDAKGDKVYRYAGAATRLSGSQNAASSFSLNSANSSAADLVTDGGSIWVVNNSSLDKVFKYTVSGALLGSWEITSAGGSPTGITIDPTNVHDIWIVDNATDRVYPFAGAASRTSGFQNPGISFSLAAGNANPQGIADPPADGVQIGDVGVQSAANAIAASDSALLTVVGELNLWLPGGKKRR